MARNYKKCPYCASEKTAVIARFPAEAGMLMLNWAESTADQIPANRLLAVMIEVRDSTIVGAVAGL